MRICFIVVILTLVGGVSTLISDWSIPLDFSIAGSPFRSFGKLVISDINDGEFVGNFAELEKLLSSAFRDAIAANNTELTYRFRTGNVQTSTYPCLFILSGLAHEISVSVDLEHRRVHSLTIFPKDIYDLDDANDKIQCTADGLKNFRPKFTVGVKVVMSSELPSPDTASYLQRIEDEKRARQHGATQDNRSFLAKYWMYILPVVVFMVVSNVFNAEPQGQAD